MLKYQSGILSNSNFSSFLPPSSDNKIQEVLKKIINKLENLNINNKDMKNVPSLQYDVNLSKIIAGSKNYNHFKNIILKIKC